MRSVIILEVEHGEDTDDVQAFVDLIHDIPLYDGPVVVKDYIVRVDIPECFVLDSGNTD